MEKEERKPRARRPPAGPAGAPMGLSPQHSDHLHTGCWDSESDGLQQDDGHSQATERRSAALAVGATIGAKMPPGVVQGHSG